MTRLTPLTAQLSRSISCLRVCPPPQQRSFFSPSSRKSTDDAKEEEPVVRTTIDQQGIATVTLNRPHKLNALNFPMFESIRDTAVQLQADRSLRAVLLTGEGRAFCSGLDVPALVRAGDPAVLERLLERPDGEMANLAQDVAMRWRQLPVPVIACLHGVVLGGGLQIALGADVRLAMPDCRLSVMEAKWGLIPDMGAAVTLRELIGIDKAKELTWTGRIVEGTEAAALGLVTRVVEDPLAEGQRMAEHILRGSPDAVSSAKKLYHSTWTAVPDEYCLRVESELQRQLLLSWNQLAASGRAFGWRIPYFQRRKRVNIPAPPPVDEKNV
jgi:enoyl-CoA hydratase/carnithine racemase